MKTCSRCREAKPRSEFNKLTKAKDGLQYYCRVCISRRYYETSDHHKQMVYKRTKRIVDDHSRRIYEYLLEHTCVDCPETDPVVLDFDHVRGTKVLAVSGLVNLGYRWEAIEMEIAKCEVRCANCHRRKTARERRYRRFIWGGSSEVEQLAFN